MSAEADTVREIAGEPRWLTPGVDGIGLAGLLSDLGHEVPTALLAWWMFAGVAGVVTPRPSRLITAANTGWGAVRATA